MSEDEIKKVLKIGNSSHLVEDGIDKNLDFEEPHSVIAVIAGHTGRRARE